MNIRRSRNLHICAKYADVNKISRKLSGAIIVSVAIVYSQLFAQPSRMPEAQPGIVMARLRPGFNIEAILQSMPSASARAALQREQSLTFNPGITLQISSVGAERIAAIRLAEEPLLRTYAIQYNSNESPRSVCKRLSANPAIEIIEPKYIEYMLDQPNDPEIGKQTYLNVIRAFEAWDVFPGDSNVVIGICDNGVMKTHEDLTGNIARNWLEIPDNGKDDDGNGYIDDYDGVNLASFADDGTKPGDTYVTDSHGTNVSGLAGATVNNGIGVAGTGGRCRIFPIKAGRYGKSGVYYGYEGIIYAATRGFAVVNCSWGSTNTYSAINESFINFATTRGTAVVAAAGNEQNTAPLYPAAYRGALGVGETDASDRISITSAIGAHVRIMAPGRGAYTTSTGNSYEAFAGTSSASPIAAAHVAMIRAMRPSLDAFQAVEFARLCGDDIRGVNSYWASMIPLRMNMLKAALRDPFSSPAIAPLEQIYCVRNDTVSRFLAGDTVSMTIRVKNYLGNASNIRFELSQPDISQPVKLLDSVVKIASIESGKISEVGHFRYIVSERSAASVMLRVDIEADNDYGDFFLFPFTPTSDISVFQNDAIALTVADNGSLGYAGDGSSLRGGGLLIKPYQNALSPTAYSGYSTALVATADDMKTMVSFPAWSDFGARKLLVEPQKNVSVLIDSTGDFADKRIGLKLRAEYTPDPNSLPVIRIDLKAENETDSVINNLSLGYFFDWDIGKYGENNQTREYPEGTNGDINSAAMLAWRAGDYPFIGVGVGSSVKGSILQTAGLDRQSIFNYTNQIKEELYPMFNSGGAMRFNGVGDIAMAAGVKFPGSILRGDSRECSVCIAAAADEMIMREALQKCLLGGSVKADDANNLIVANVPGELKVFPRPAVNFVRFEGNFKRAITNRPIEARLFDELGRLTQSSAILPSDAHAFGSFDATGLENGVYRLILTSGIETLSAQVIIAR